MSEKNEGFRFLRIIFFSLLAIQTTRTPFLPLLRPTLFFFHLFSLVARAFVYREWERKKSRTTTTMRRRTASEATRPISRNVPVSDSTTKTKTEKRKIKSVGKINAVWSAFCEGGRDKKKSGWKEGMRDMETLPTQPNSLAKISPSIRRYACFLVGVTANAGIDTSNPSFLSPKDLFCSISNNVLTI